MDPPKLDDTYGGALIGLVVGTILYGITILQTYLYFRRYPQDYWFVKFMVILLWALDSVHLVLCTITIYWVLVTNYSNPEVLSQTHWSMNLQTDCNGLIGLVVELFFARRVWIMSRNWLLTGIIIVLANVHFMEAFLLASVKEFPKLVWVTSTGLGSAAAADIIIAVSLCFYLTRSRTGFKRTDSLISALIAYSLTTGLVTSVIASVCVVTFAIMPTNFVWLSFFWVLGKCYVNSFLAALNSRDYLRERAMGHRDGSFLQLSQLHRSVTSYPEFSTPMAILKPTPLSINVTAETSIAKKEERSTAESGSLEVV
ncbi:hypothetical protein BDN71DRAFT_1238899 [Pleurotus eryngii]|uniref:DUF6534 domain-containing protein n=1 Tax=Pleurotus eryngii TaxID=5323 RepID=A0A9P5ZUI1_PLEER|nr:hypothetical protein BDN71DRAFT_1238899 [Pleurotus eryngii]